MPRAPWVRDSTPRQRDQEGRKAADKDDRANIVDLAEFLSQRTGDSFEIQKGDDEESANSDEREVDIEYPPLYQISFALETELGDIPRSHSPRSHHRE